VAFRIEACDLGGSAREQQQLVPHDQLADRDRICRLEADAVYRVLRPPHLADDVAEREVGKVVDEVLGEGRPVRMGRAATRQALGGAGNQRRHARSRGLTHRRSTRS